MVFEAEHPLVGSFRLVGMPIKLSATPGRLRRPPPTVGQHNEEILTSLGLAAHDIERLRHEGVIGAETDRQRNTGTVAWGPAVSG
jgi:crotonobetainyl-CoA:carnitine CoA-transferase CaiB-like acyl-CoA transferase